MNPCVLFRRDLESEGEFDDCAFRLPTTQYRSQIPPESLVIGRYSVLPYYGELEKELKLKGSALINTYEQHQFIADCMTWAGQGGCLNGLTPLAYPNWSNIPEGAYVVKGRTNSRKHQWKTHMFAPTRADIPTIAGRLWDDSLIKDQGLVVRPYVPLKKLGDGLNGLPITNEWRTFWLMYPDWHPFPLMLGHGFYWASHPEFEAQAQWTREMADVAFEAAQRIGKHAAFFVLDIAETADGKAIIIECNDGQMSGLSSIPASRLYFKLKAALDVAISK